MRLNYIHFNNFKPLYVGEGKPGREKQLRRTGIYGGWLKNHPHLHVCVLTVGNFSDAVSSQLNEQGLISWLGRGMTRDGALMNVLPYSTASGCGPSSEKLERLRMRMTLNNPASRPEVRELIGKRTSQALIGRTLSNQHKENLKKSLSGRPQEKVECPHCGKVGGKSIMKHYHFDNCKHRAP